MKKRIALVDCDGVLTNCHQAFADACNLVNGTSFTAEDAAREWDIAKGFGLSPEQTKRMYAELNKPGVARRMTPLPGAIEGVQKLLNCPDLQVAICTAAMDTSPTWAHDRRKWVQDYLGDVPVISTHDKWLCRGDFLIDDSHKNLVAWAKFGPPGAMGVWWVPSATQPVPPRTEVHQDWDRVLISCCL
jgi:5'(3')-deoxyribonucleotidase